MSAIEQRARELLAEERKKDLSGCAIRAIICALTLPEGFVLVPVEPTNEMVNAAADAYMPFGDMEFAIQAAISARPEAK